MAGNWLVNLFLGIISFLITFWFSLENNIWQMSLFRAGIGFLLFFLLGYILRFLLHQISLKKTVSSPEKQGKEEIGGQTKQPKDSAEEQNGDPLFQAVTLGALHNGEILENTEEFPEASNTWNTQN